jgi:hypothetical protein
LREISADEQVRPALASIRAKAMAERPQDRYRSALELSVEVARYLDGERVEAHRETLWERAGRLFARHYMWIVLIAAYLVMRMVLLLVLHR